MNRPDPSSHRIVIAGPTAVGKSAVALELANQINGEIISVDSMQVYRGLDIGTAKLTPEERRGIPHHLIDVVELTEAFDAARFAVLAGEAVLEIQSRKRVPVFCGGSGFYLKAYLEGLDPMPPASAVVRGELEATPQAGLLRELEERDPATLARIDRSNRRRVVRALEVIRLTGKPLAARHTGGKPERGERHAGLFIGLTRASDDLIARIEARVEEMFERGLVEETRELLERGLAGNPTALQAIGYRQAVEYLRGDRSLAETVARVKQKSRQFARRQLTWFRRQIGLEWISLVPGDTATEIAARLAQRWRKLGL